MSKAEPSPHQKHGYSLLGELEIHRATLRIISLILDEKVHNMDRMALIEFLETFNITKSEFYRSYEALRDIGLAVNYSAIETPRIVMTDPTEKGRMMGKLVDALIEVLMIPNVNDVDLNLNIDLVDDIEEKMDDLVTFLNETRLKQNFIQVRGGIFQKMTTDEYHDFLDNARNRSREENEALLEKYRARDIREKTLE